MHSKIQTSLHLLSSKKALERKKAIKQLMRFISHKDAYLVRLSLHYVSIHDPSYTVRNIARQAFFRIGEPPSDNGGWDKAYLF